MGRVTPFPAPAPPLPPPPPPEPPGPKNLPFWADPKKPKAAQVIETAHKDRARFAGYADVVARMVEKLELETETIFDSEADNEDAEPFHSPALKIEHDRFCSWGSNHDIIVRAPFFDPLDAEEASQKEDAGHFWLECWARQHGDAGYSDLAWALFDTLATYGRLATLVTCDFADDQCGFTFRTLDPATTFPFFEGKRGLHHVSMVYAATASEILGYYGDPNGKLERKLKKETSVKDSDYGLDTEGEVIEWIDRANHMVLWNGVEVKNTRHGYGFVPVRYDRGPWGRQAFTSATAIQSLAATQISVVTPQGQRTGWVGRGTSGGGRSDEAKVGLPFQYWKLKPHRTMEAFMSLQLSTLIAQLKPPVWVTQGYESSRQGVPELDMGPGKISTLREDERAEIPQFPMIPQLLQTVAGQLIQDQAMGSVGTVAYGVAPPQTTGSAATILDAEGKEIWAPGLRTFQNHVTGVLEMCARLYTDWGELLGAPGSRGFFNMPRRRNTRAGSSQAFKMTPQILQRVGIRFQVELHRFNIGTIAQVGAGITQLIQAGVIGEEDGSRMLGWDPNPQAGMQRRLNEQLSKAPAILMAHQLRRLVEDAQAAEMRGDLESAEKKWAEVEYVSHLMQMEEAQKQIRIQSMQLGMQEREMGMMRTAQRDLEKAARQEEEALAEEEKLMAEQEAPAALPPPPPPPSGPIIPQGGVASLPAYGIQTGTQGGRPAQGPPPGSPALPTGRGD